MVRTKFNTMIRTRYTTEERPNIEDIPIPKWFRLGRPPIIQHPDQLRAVAMDYFQSCFTKSSVIHIDANGNKVQRDAYRHTKPFTMSGLAAYMGINRMTLLAYERERPDLSSTVKEIKAVVESYAEECLYNGKGTATGVIFSMTNNFNGWLNVRREEHTGPNGTPLGVDITTNDEKARQTREKMLAELGPEDTE